MKKNNSVQFPGTSAFLCASLFMLLTTGCKKSMEPVPNSALPDEAEMQSKKSENDNSSGKKIGHFNQINLVANTTGFGTAHIDPTLINGWGIAFSPGGNPWVNSQGGHVSEVYNREGEPTTLGSVHIPLPVATEGGNPTGIVFSASTTDFIIPGGPARFIFVGVDGVLSAWNGTLGKHAFRKAVVPLSAFTGLALAANGGNNFLYAANFRARKINVWDRNWKVVDMPFTDPNLPAGYSPYNIQNIGGLLYVAYSKVGPTGRSQSGINLGYVDVYNTNGSFVKRFASAGTLNNPWGMTMAPAGFFGKEKEDEGDDDNAKPVILIGNFGDGRINAYRTDGKFLGQLRGQHDPLTIDGLWAITFPPSTSTIDPNRLYFAAGPANETNGLFGYIIARLDDDK